MSGAGAGIQDVVAAEWLDPGLRRGDKKARGTRITGLTESGVTIKGGLVKNQKMRFSVIPAQAGIQGVVAAKRLDPGLRRGDKKAMEHARRMGRWRRGAEDYRRGDKEG